MTSASAAQPRDVLTQVEAEERFARVSNTRYDLTFDIRAGSATYRGDVTIRFDLAGSGATFLDFRGKTTDVLEVNGQRVEPVWNGYRLELPGDVLSAANTVHVVYENEYDHTGDGFHQFIDPADGQEYLYTNFEPYEAHRLFPCFDQPDIKATYAVTVTAPAEWEVVSNYRETGNTPADEGRSRRTFATTKPFSTYLFALVAGPYHAFRDQHGDIPLGLFCRKSLVEKLDTEELFTITKQGLDFFADFFDCPYPFDKYDQLFVPEFNAGAMENVGCVTHNEYMVFRETPTENQRRGRAETVLHEMAHMWFGDLVTMKWWNDLWLNESFATYMSYLCLEHATRFQNGWQDFASSIKNWAYRQDQLVTTHPIAGQVRDTDETLLNFDGITYGKGASVLKQLVASIGLEGFREGMRHYFRTHAFGNTTLSQFMASLETGSGRELLEWSRLWLETPSLNTIAAEWTADGDRISGMSVTQTAPEDYPTIRPHYLELGLAREEAGKLQVTTVPVRIDSGRVDVPEAQGKPRPQFVFPNYADLAYAKVALDKDSVAYIRENLGRVDDTLLRQMLWSSLWNMVRDQHMKSTEFLELVRKQLPGEQDIQLVDSILGQATLALGRFVPDRLRDEEAHKVFEMAKAALRDAPEGDAKIIWARSLIATATVPEDVEYTARLADGTETIPGVTIDQDMRWSIAVKFAGYGMQGATERVAAEAQRDTTDRGQRARIQAEVSVPSAEVKAAAWERINGEGYGSLYLTNAAMGGFNWWKQRNILEPYYERFFEAVRGVFETRDKEFATDYFRALFPAYRVEQATLDRSERLLATVPEDEVMLRRSIREANDELTRAIRCRALVDAG